MCCVFSCKRIRPLRQTGLSSQKLHVFWLQRKEQGLGEREPRIPIAYSRDSIINYTDERMRPRVKGSFLNARCGLTDSPPCPPTAPLHPVCPPPIFLTQAHRPLSTSGSPYVHVRIRARPDFTTIERDSLGSPLSYTFFFSYWTKVASYERVYAFPDICRNVRKLVGLGNSSIFFATVFHLCVSISSVSPHSSVNILIKVTI